MQKENVINRNVTYVTYHRLKKKKKTYYRFNCIYLPAILTYFKVLFKK